MRLEPNTILLVLLIAQHGYCYPAQGEETTHAKSTANTTSDEVKLGWTSEPNGRGTIGIITNTLFTLFLCSWSVLCVNVPAPQDKTYFRLYRKLYLTILTILAPEFIFQASLSQLLLARKSVKAFKAAGYDDWTLTHGFYANMGGFRLQTKSKALNGKDWGSFPIDAEQLLYLIKRGYVERPQITVQEISDKNKSDGILRAITALQITWFGVNMIARIVQKLAITTIELTLVAFIFCAIWTQICWFYKPADINVPEIIRMKINEETRATQETPTEYLIEDILMKDEGSMGAWSRTPLDFISRREWEFSILWTQGRGYLRSMGFTFGKTGTPAQRIENTTLYEIEGWLLFVTLLVAGIYSSIFFVAWNFSFPTKTEQTLWRTSCIVQLVIPVAMLAWVKFIYHLYPRFEARFPILKRDNLWSAIAGDYELKKSSHAPIRFYGRVLAYFRNSTVMKEPQVDTTLKAVLPSYSLFFVYCVFRTYIWVEDFAELRSLPASAYQTASWAWIAPWW